MRNRLSSWLCCLLVTSASLGISAGQSEPQELSVEWPGLWGAFRNAQTGTSWAAPLDPRLEVVWRRAVGKGYSEVVASGTRAYLLATDGEKDFLSALDLTDGHGIWRREVGPTYRGHDGSDDGPIATPALGDGRIFVATPVGILIAFEEVSGRELWRLDLKKSFGAKIPFYGYASSPLLLDEKLIIQTGAEEGKQLVALNAKDGKVLWAVHPTDGNGYSSPVAIRFGQENHLVGATTKKIFAVDEETGKTLWFFESPGEPRQSPIGIPEERLLVTTHSEAVLLQLRKTGEGWGVEEIWRLPVLKASYSPTVFRDGYLYGMNRTYLVCLEAATGAVQWREKVYHGSLILMGDVLAVMGERSGIFRLAAADPKGYRELLKESLIPPGSRTIAGMAALGSRLLIRNSEEVVLTKVVTDVVDAEVVEEGTK